MQLKHPLIQGYPDYSLATVQLVVASQKYLAKEYKAEASRWGEIDANRWNAL